MKKTAGQIIVEHDALKLSLDDDIKEYRKAMEAETVAELYRRVDEYKKHSIYTNKDFYVVLVLKTQSVLRQPQRIYIARQSCPTPVYKQCVWKYHHLSQTLEFLWAIPDAITYHHILRNSERLLKDKDQAERTKFVVLMESGELLKWVKKENGNKKDAVIILNQEPHISEH